MSVKYLRPLAAMFALLMAVSLPVQAQAAPVKTAARAMWLWSQANPASVVSWASTQKVREIFVYVSAAPTAAETTRLRELRTRTRAAGIRLAALNGEPAWVDTPQVAVAWRRAVMATGFFDGVHLDVEPYLLPAWTTDQAATVDAYLNLLGAVRAAGPEPFEVDVPFWLGEVPAGDGTLADAVLSRVKAVTVMSYRDTGGALLDVGADFLARGARVGVPVRLAAETRPLADCANCTFAEEGRAVLTRRLADVDAGASALPSYAGVAVHDYDGWVALRL